MPKIDQVIGTGVPLLLDDIDTDRIIPARYLRCVTFDGLGEHAFEDDRAQDPDHPFDDPRYAGGGVLIAGRNFGCGSSREHAPQALMRWGIRAILGESFAEIFFGNCTALGIPAVTASREDLKSLAEAVRDDPQAEIVVDLLKREARLISPAVEGDEATDPHGLRVPIAIPEAARTALTTGEFDFLAQLLEGTSEIRNTAERLPYLTNFTN